jgi:hypothetical protein
MSEKATMRRKDSTMRQTQDRKRSKAAKMETLKRKEVRKLKRS